MHKIVWLAVACGLVSWAQTPSSVDVPARMVITVGHFYGHERVVLTPGDVTVTLGFDPMQVTSLTPLRGERAGLELFVLVDDCSNCEVGSKFEELRRFITSQPATTLIGIAYIQDGRLRVVEKPTQDRERALKALNAPAGSKPASPFRALTELVNGWHANSSSHAVLMISNGIDPAATEGLQNPSAEEAIETCQRAGVALYTIYHPNIDYATSDFSKIYSGQVQLAHVAEETGGEAYFLSFGPLPSLAPFLADMADHFADRYLLEFLAKPSAGPGSLQEVMVKSKLPNVDLMAPDKVWIPEKRSSPSGPRSPELN